MSIEKDLKRIIGKIWFAKNNFKSIVKSKLLTKRANSIQDIVGLMANYNPEKKDFAHRLVLDNYMGSIQRYLTGYDLGSIHLSAKSLEVAFLFKIGTPCQDERHSSFGDLGNISISRGLIRRKQTIRLAWNVVNRRNMTMHDAIPEQALLWACDEWIEQKLQEVPNEYRNSAEIMLKPLISKLQDRLELFSSLPDLRWYVMKRSFLSTKELIINFLEETIGRDLAPLERVKGKGVKEFIIRLSKIPKIMKNVKSSMVYELDFMEYSARQNIKDVRTVLDEVYDNELLRF